MLKFVPLPAPAEVRPMSRFLRILPRPSLSVLVFMFAFCVNYANAQTDPSASLLSRGQPIERLLKPSEIHAYSFNIEAGQFAQVVVTSKDIEMRVALFRADGTQVTRTLSDRDETDSKSVSMIAAERQAITVQVHTPRPIARNGIYTIVLAKLRAAEKQDQDLIAGEKLLAEALRMPLATQAQRKAKIDKFQTAADLLRSAGALSDVADALTRIGRNYNLSGDRKTAARFYQQALELTRQIGDRRGEAFVLTLMGFFLAASGELQAALDNHEQALRIRREVNDTHGEAASLFQIGLVYQRLGDSRRALSYHLKALPVVRQLGDASELARTLSYAADACVSLGLFQEALDYYGQSLTAQKRDLTKQVARSSLRRMASVYVELGQTSKALELLNELLTLEDKYEDSANKTGVLLALAEIYVTAKDSQKARQHLVEALSLVRRLNDRPREATAHYLLSRIEQQENNLSGALNEIESTIHLVESIRSRINSEELRISFFATVEKYYDQYLQVLWALHKNQPTKGLAEKALTVSEQTRGRGLIELLRESDIDIRNGAPRELLARERSLQKQLNQKADAQTPLLGERPTPEQAVELAKEIEELTTALDDLRTQLRRESPAYAALTQPQTASLKEIQQTLDEHTTLLEFKLGEDRSFLWTISQTEFHAFELPRRVEIEALARQVYQFLITRGQPGPFANGRQTQTGIINSEDDYWVTATKLSQMLLGPATPVLKPGRLLIVADGVLEYLPFAALPVATATQNGISPPRVTDPPLVVDHEIVSLPSASIINVLRRETAQRKSSSRGVAVFADPVFAKNDVRVTRGAESKSAGRAIRSFNGADESAKPNTIGQGVEAPRNDRPAITRLPFSRREANAIVGVAADPRTYAALDFAASLSNATSPKLAQFSIIHFATHGWLDSARPELSGVVLSLVDQKGRPQEGVLRLHEIYNLHLGADLVVLSACQTALGKEVRGEGLIGLTRGFMYAGAPRVAATLWRVDDAATAELMGHFYRFMLKEKLSPAAALRAAQLEIMKQKRWQSPYYWAGFVLQGEWR